MARHSTHSNGRHDHAEDQPTDPRLESSWPSVTTCDHCTTSPDPRRRTMNPDEPHATQCPLTRPPGRRPGTAASTPPPPAHEHSTQQDRGRIGDARPGRPKGAARGSRGSQAGGRAPRHLRTQAHDETCRPRREHAEGRRPAEHRQSEGRLAGERPHRTRQNPTASQAARTAQRTVRRQHPGTGPCGSGPQRTTCHAGSGPRQPTTAQAR